ncbi:MAG TPA: efflux RND transporter periplasmic adaptor subunit [Tepidisphaeraceae bacterium]|nr:efflux RND transporter periplasmic adaptor subunit [Tepidisphaeraceae bacterium]
MKNGSWNSTAWLIALAIGALAAVVWMISPHHTGGIDGNVASATTTTSGQPSSSGEHLWTCGMHPQVLLPHPGNCPICGMKLTPVKDQDHDDHPAAGKSQRKIAYWWDPMLGASSVSDHPGKSAMGMDLVPVYDEQLQSGPGVRIDPTVVQNIGVETAAVTRGPLNVTVRAVGVLMVPTPGLHDVTLKISGFVQKLYADTEGAAVVKGDVLFDLYSPELIVAGQELSAAEQSLKSLDANASDAQRAEANAMVESAKSKLRLWDIDERDIEAMVSSGGQVKTVPIRSPADGYVTDKMIVQGSAVQAGMKLMRIVDQRSMWLDVQVYPGQAERVAMGQPVRTTIDGLPGKTFNGKITFIAPQVDQNTLAQTVRTTLDNPDHELRPGMFATANITTQPVQDTVMAPREAVIDTGARQIAFVMDATNPGHFQPRNVRMGIAGDDDKVQIVEGLAPGDQVVTSGQFLMDVESRTTEAIQKLRSAGMAGGGAKSAAATTAPAELTLAHCSMWNTDWLQVGDGIANPYAGSLMLTCGNVLRRVSGPANGTPLAGVIDAYLKIEQGLDADKIDANATAAIKRAADLLTGDRYVSLRQASDRLATAADLTTAREAFKNATDALIPLLEEHH